MIKKLTKSLPLFLAFAIFFTLTAFAQSKEPVYLETAPTVSAVGVASKDLSSLMLIEGSCVDKEGNPVPGLFLWGNPTAKLEPGIHEVSVVFAPVDSTTYARYRFTVKVHAYKLNLTVKKLPTVEEKLAVNKPVSELTLYDGVAVNHFDPNHPPIEGHFEFVNPDQKFDKAGTYECAVVFKPEDSELYNDSVVTYARNPNRTFKNAFVKVTVQ